MHGRSSALGISIWSMLTSEGKYRVNLKEGKSILITIEYEKELTQMIYCEYRKRQRQSTKLKSQMAKGGMV